MVSPGIVATLALAMASATVSHACVAIARVSEELYGDGLVDTNIIRIGKEKVRIDMGRDPDIYQVFRVDSAVLWTVNLKEKTYLRRTGQDVAAMRAEWIQGVGKLRERAENLPPERRKEMQDKKIARLVAEARTMYRKAGDGGKVGRWPTVKHIGFRKKEKVSEEWVAEAADLGIPEPDARALRDKDGYFDKYSSGWPGQDSADGNGPVGVTVKLISFRDGKPMVRTEFLAIREEACADGLFDIPPGLTLRVLEAR